MEQKKSKATITAREIKIPNKTGIKLDVSIGLSYWSDKKGRELGYCK